MSSPIVYLLLSLSYVSARLRTAENLDEEERKKTLTKVRIACTAIGVLFAVFVAIRVCVVLNRRHRGPPPVLPTANMNILPIVNTMMAPHRDQGHVAQSYNPTQTYPNNKDGFDNAYYPPASGYNYQAPNIVEYPNSPGYSPSSTYQRNDSSRGPFPAYGNDDKGLPFYRAPEEREPGLGYDANRDRRPLQTPPPVHPATAY